MLMVSSTFKVALILTGLRHVWCFVVSFFFLTLTMLVLYASFNFWNWRLKALTPLLWQTSVLFYSSIFVVLWILSNFFLYKIFSCGRNYLKLMQLEATWSSFIVWLLWLDWSAWVRKLCSSAGRSPKDSPVLQLRSSLWQKGPWHGSFMFSITVYGFLCS